MLKAFNIVKYGSFKNVNIKIKLTFTFRPYKTLLNSLLFII